MLPEGKEVVYGLIIEVQRQHHSVPKIVFTTWINHTLCMHLDGRLVTLWPRKRGAFSPSQMLNCPSLQGFFVIPHLGSGKVMVAL